MEILYCAPCLFGLEGLVADELRRMGATSVRAENGRVYFSGDWRIMARANLRLRCAERVLIVMGSFKALSFDALFEGVKALPWQDFLSMDALFPVTGSSLNSKLASIPDCQAIVKKAVVEKLKLTYKTSWFSENGAPFRIRFSIMKDQAELYVDTSGDGLHKRGYRAVAGEAPLRETLAAAMAELARYRGRGVFFDPFCGSGTILIEAALLAKNRAPGLTRDFAAQAWPQIARALWNDERSLALSGEFDGDYELRGGDIDPKAVALARENARKAGVDRIIRVETADIADFAPAEPSGTVVTNPPYGQRISDAAQAKLLYRQLGAAMENLPGWKCLALSPHEDFETEFGRPATKKRKLYNGMLRCNLYMYEPERGIRP